MANFTLDLSVSKAPKITAIVYARVGDKQGIKADVSLVDIDGQPFNLTGATITFKGMNGKNEFVADSAGVVTTGYDLSKGKFGYVFPPSAFGAEGKYKLAYFSFLMPTTKATISSGNIDIIVYDWADVTAPEAEEALNNYNKLVEELQELQKQHIDEINDGFDDVNARMVQLNQDIMDALAKFEAGNFYTKTQSDAKYMFKNNLAMGADDWNDYTEIGTYGITTSTGANAPVNSTGTLLVQGYGTGGTQVFINNNSIRYRTNQGGGNWTSWRILTHIGETNYRYMNINSTDVVAQDWNTLTTIGTYNVQGATGANRPSSIETWGTLLVQGKVHDDNMLTQLFIGDTVILFRRKLSPTNWTTWRTASPAVANSEEINAGTDNTKMITANGLQGSKYNKSTVFGAWTNIPLNTGYKGADSTVPKYRIIAYMQSDGTTKKYIELDGAVTNDAGSIGSSPGIQGQWWLQAEALRPAQTKMFPAQTSVYSTTGRLAIAPSGICYFGQNSGAPIDYFYITGMGYWLGE